MVHRVAGERGFEPPLYGPEPYVLPLDDSPADKLICYQKIIKEAKRCALKILFCFLDIESIDPVFLFDIEQLISSGP